MSISRKHFKALAASLKMERPDNAHDPHAASQWHRDCHAIADACKRLNSGFQRSKFLAACGAEVTHHA